MQGSKDDKPSSELAAQRPAVWHALGGSEVLALIGVDEHGLAEAQVPAQRDLHGDNRLPAPHRDSVLVVFLKQFRSPLIYLLLAATVVSVFLERLSDAGFIFGVLVLNAVIGAVQERRAATSALALQRLARSTATVLRDGRRQRLDSTEIVVGDIVDLESGMHVPADIRLLTSRDLTLNESLLTGESTPVQKNALAAIASTATLGDRSTMSFAGTTVLQGRATGVVVAVGTATELGSIAAAVAETTEAPMQRKLERLARQIGLLMVGAIAGLSAIQYVEGAEFGHIFLVAVALAVAAIPEGLPVAITVAMSVSMTRMARRNVIVRSLLAVEGLGACTLIASDKTGTLTCNELTVKRLWLPVGGGVSVGGEGYAVRGEMEIAPADRDRSAVEAELQALAESAALCNEAYLYLSGDEVHHLGDTVDVAFLVLAAKLGMQREHLDEAYPLLATIAYEPSRRFAATYRRTPDGTPWVYVKGAAETVLPMCDLPDGGDALAAAEAMARDGYRVLAVAAGPVAADDAEKASAAALAGLRFLGFAGLIDPVRSDVPAALAACRESGIDVRMITGDHAATALAIARQLGLADSPDEVVTGSELSELAGLGDAAALRQRAASATIFARVDAVQKLEIVRLLQEAGHVVAVTGDGANDAPALNASDIGVALGRQGTDVARGAADLVIADDNFASIVAGIEEGRIAYDNVRKVTMLLIGTGIGEIVLFMLSLAAGLPIPLFAVQLLWLNLVTNGIQDVALAFEKGEKGVLQRAPRPPRQPIFDRRMIVQTSLAGGYIGLAGFLFFYWAINANVPEDEARAALLLLFVLFENVHVFNCRSENVSAFAVPLRANPFAAMAVLLALLLQAGAMHWTPAAGVLDIMPVSGSLMALVLPVAAGLVLLMELQKFLARRGEAQHSRKEKP